MTRRSVFGAAMVAFRYLLLSYAVVVVLITPDSVTIEVPAKLFWAAIVAAFWGVMK